MEALAAVKELRVYKDEIDQIVNKISDQEYEIACIDYEKIVFNYNHKVDAYKALNPEVPQWIIDKEIGNYPWPPPMGRKAPLRAAGLYHTMLKKIIPFAIKGVLFYQGESDAHKATLYNSLLGNMIQNWRKDWGMPQMPFLMVQLTDYFDTSAPKDSWAIVRETQLNMMKQDENIATAVIIDCGQVDDIHPINKKPVGERLALLARAKVYGQAIECFGPQFREMKIQRDKIVVAFDYVAAGFVIKGNRIKGFKISEEDLQFVDADAVINGNTIEVRAVDVRQPVAVRFGWANVADVNLFNSLGLPASPFRTDSMKY